jgi:amidase
MDIEDWREIKCWKQSSNWAKIPPEWQLDQSFLDTINASSNMSVIETPSNCGILTSKERDLTESYDAVRLLDEMGKGNIRLEYTFSSVLRLCS